MEGYIKFEFKLNDELYELTTQYDELRREEIDDSDDSITVYNLITNADFLKVKNKEISGEDLEEMLDEDAVITDFIVNDYALYNTYLEQIAVDDFNEWKESVVIW